MITAEDFETAFVDLIHKNARLPYDVSLDYIGNAKDSYIWVELQARKTNWDAAYFQWAINVDIQVILTPDDYAVVKYTGLWDIADSLTKAIMPCMRIKDRFITVQDFNASIIDDVLHYEFNLDFTDYVQNDEYEGAEYELMQDLKLDF